MGLFDIFKNLRKSQFPLLFLKKRSLPTWHHHMMIIYPVRKNLSYHIVTVKVLISQHTLNFTNISMD